MSQNKLLPPSYADVEHEDAHHSLAVGHAGYLRMLATGHAGIWVSVAQASEPGESVAADALRQ
jgi:hypothetical protein